jgi:hypothetical protein
MFVGLCVDRDGAEFGCVDPHCLLQDSVRAAAFPGIWARATGLATDGAASPLSYPSRPDRVPSPAGRIQFSSLATRRGPAMGAGRPQTRVANSTGCRSSDGFPAMRQPSYKIPRTRSGSCAPRCTACSDVRRLRKTCSTDCNAL